LRITTVFISHRAPRARTFAVPAALVLLAALVSLAPTPAAAQRDACNDYANQQMSFDQRARQQRCTGWTGHSNYQAHYDWCLRQTPQRVQQAVADWGSAFQRCQFQASGSPAAGAGRPAWNIQWVQVGGAWRSGVYRVATDRCTHGAAGSYCGPNEDWRGEYGNGAVTQWRRGGCQNPVISIRCTVTRAP
jgi:hypothetical protein